ncbi:MAG: molybdopterin cofactor-binding domain-containing protein [Chthoniobacteraceae bacterium]
MNESSIKLADTLDRRQFLKAAGGLLLAITLDGATNRSVAEGVVSTGITTYLAIGADEIVTVYVGGGEMGQGIYTGLAMAAAEELKVDWSAVQVQPITAASSWLSAGSGGIRSRLPTFLKAGAAAREMLISAAATQWGVNRTLCQAANGAVTNTDTGDTLTYGQLAPAAALLPVPAAPPLTPASQYQIIGTPAQRVDLPPKTNGAAKYGVDTFIPGMLFASVKHSPVMGGVLNSTPTKPSGSIALVPLLPLVNGVLGTVANAVGVVATNTYQAINYANSVSATKWTAPTTANLMDNTVQLAQAKQLLGRGTPYIAEQIGDVDAGLASAATTVDATYTFPYLAHCCMEVISCTVKLTATTCEIWAPTQAPNTTLNTAALVSGLPKTSITIHPTFMGGGLGRKFEQDYISQAIQIAKGLPVANFGTPVKMIWSREQDMANDQFRPMAMIRIQAGVDADGNVTAWKCRHVSPSISKQRGATLGAKGDANATEGSTVLPYAFGSRLVDYVVHPSPIPVGYWRSVGYSLNAFAVESMMDELALAAGLDGLEFRQNLLANSTDPLAARTLACLNDAAANAGYVPWATSPTTAFGIAVTMAFNTIVAECAYISATATSIKVLNVACTVDCGTAVNPDSVEAQMQGGIFHGLSAALWGQVKWTAGKPGASNFNNYRVLRMNEAPNITVNIINSGAPMSGCGEPGVPPIAPAVANAFAKITGNRVRTLPFFPGARMDGI